MGSQPAGFRPLRHRSSNAVSLTELITDTIKKNGHNVGGKKRQALSEWQVHSTGENHKVAEALPGGAYTAPCFLGCGRGLWAERAPGDHHLHFIKNNWRSLQTFFANMQLSGMGRKETFSKL